MENPQEYLALTEQLYCNGKVIFLYDISSPPAKQVGLGFRHLHFSEHEKLQCLQQDKSHTIKEPFVQKHTKDSFSYYLNLVNNYFCSSWNIIINPFCIINLKSYTSM